jgi:peptide/nickel transport system substrate-binding protein
MRKSAYGALRVAVAGLVAAGLAACGSSSKSSTTGGTSTSSSAAPSLSLKPGENPAGQPLTGGKKGGQLTVYTSIDFEHLDPGSTYFTLDYAVMYATQRPLFRYPPNSTSTLVPDLATAIPTTANGGITDGGKTVTVHIQPNVHFSPPVNRAVTSADVAYGIERAANPNVGNAYFVGYFGSGSPTPLEGADNPKYTGGPIPGIQTPNPTTIVFHMTKPGATFLVQALSMPIAMPVPESMAGPMDKHAPTTYGVQAEAFSGPYMIKSNAQGVFQGIGYQTGKQLTLVRNPNWSASTYTPLFQPQAYLDGVNVSIGGNSTVIGEQVLKGSKAVQLDQPTHTNVELAYKSYPSQVTFTPGVGIFYSALNNAKGPFTNTNLRRAVWANLDRAGIVKVVGGPLVAQPMTHFIYPGNAGFVQAGGYAGPPYDFNKNTSGNLTVACRYMKAAGYSGCKYTGSATLEVVGASNGDFPAVTQIVLADLTQLGFKTHLTQVDQSVMFAKYCGVPKQEIDVCPSVAWVRDFADPLTILYVTFYGPAIVSTNNSNFGQVNIPAVNSAMESAALTIDPSARATAWAGVDSDLVSNAAYLPEYFANQPNIESGDVQGVNMLWDAGSWDFMFTSLKNP